MLIAIAKINSGLKKMEHLKHLLWWNKSYIANIDAAIGMLNDAKKEISPSRQLDFFKKGEK